MAADATGPSIVHDIVEFMHLKRETTGAVDHARAKAMLIERLSQVPQWTITEASQMMKELRHSEFDMSERTEIAAIIDSKTTLQCDVRPGHRKPGHRIETQACLTFHRYLSASDWGVLRNPASTWGTMLSTLVNRALLIGLSNPKEGTIMHMWAIVLAARTPDGDAVVADVVEALQRKKEIHSHLQLIGSRARRHYYGRVTMYPSDPSMLKDQCADAWSAIASQPPMPCPIDEASIETIRLRLPIRSSNTMAKHVAQMQPRALHRASSLVSRSLSRMSSSSFGDFDDMGINLRILQPNQRPASQDDAQRSLVMYGGQHQGGHNDGTAAFGGQHATSGATAVGGQHNASADQPRIPEPLALAGSHAAVAAQPLALADAPAAVAAHAPSAHAGR